MESCKEHIDKISAMLDDELDDLEKAELLSHINSCPECRRVYDAFSFISSALSDGLAPPPEALAGSIMKKITDKKENKKKRQPSLIRFAAIAACFALILFGASRLELFNDKLSFTSDGSTCFQTANEAADFEQSEAFIDEYQLFDSKSPLDLPNHKSLTEAFPADIYGAAEDEADNNFTAYGMLTENNRIANQLKNEISLCIADCAELRVYKGEYKDPEGKVRDSGLMLTISDRQELEQLSKLLCFGADATEAEGEPDFTLFIPADFSSSDCMEDITVKIWLENEKVIFQDSKTKQVRQAVCESEAFLELLDSLNSKQS
ncbi:MAG: hypothetical protein GX025_00225 [Clostridiales bacterium]|nr:hypothetical protein [Clostridiales bacterium]